MAVKAPSRVASHALASLDARLTGEAIAPGIPTTIERGACGTA
jgi:hypothetical protein